MKRLRVLVLVHEDLVPPDSLDGTTAKERMAWQTEYDVVAALSEMGHKVQVLGLLNDLSILRTAIEEFKPHICFNLLEEFHGVAVYDQHVVSYLELMKTPYTGCNPRGLTIAHDKALCRKILTFHRVPGPRFAVFPMDRKNKRPGRLSFPLFVKSAVEDASLGISQASVVHDDERLRERVRFIHEKIGTDALVEEYIDGRELYVSVMGNLRLQSFPVLEMTFGKLPEGAYRIATAKVKWDEAYQEKIGLDVTVTEDIPDSLQRRISTLAKRVYRILGLTGYARLDMRLTAAGEVHLIEANPNPDLADGDLFAESAYQAGVDYPMLLRRILNLGLSYRAQWRSDLG